ALARRAGVGPADPATGPLGRDVVERGGQLAQ
ncbi:DNA-binding response regulator, partial [Streptomyces sp. SID7499]|nr:DNA-binding response regulator [Streptomyces sp. SID7499]